MTRPIVRKRISTQVFERLRGKILQGQLREGCRLLEEEVGSEFSVSRTPVREALVLLQGQGLVRAIGTGGYEVCDIERELIEVLEIREVLESHVVRRLAGAIDEAQLERLERLCDKMEGINYDNWKEESAINKDFHLSIALMSNNARLYKILCDCHIFFEYQGFVARKKTHIEFMMDTRREHRLIVDALRLGDGELAAKLVCRHIDGARYLINYIKDGLVEMEESREET